MKRIAIATLFGLAAGVVCAAAGSSLHMFQLTAVSLVWVLLNRTVMGFVIGATNLKLHWAWNGIILGLVVGSIFSYYLFMTMGLKMLLLTPIGNAVYGLLIEFFTTKVFKQPAISATAAPRLMARDRAAAA